MASALLSHARRIPRHPLSTLLLHSPTRFCSSSSLDPKPEPEPIQPISYTPKPEPEPEPIQPISYAPKPKSEPINIQPVSYAPKPKPDPEPKPQPTREEIRYMKYGSSPSLNRTVAPLPEDIVKPSEVSGEVVGVDASGGQSQSQGQRHSKGLRKVFSVLEEEKQVPFATLIRVDKKQWERTVYDLYDAIRRVKANAKRNFDETVEAHVNLGIDRRRSDLGVSGSVVLPHGTGKIVKVAVFAEGAAAEEAKEAGADIVGGDELIEEIRTSGKINFDKCIATHSMMPRVTKIGKILRGLTPNAKRGTMTNNVAGAVKEAKQGLLDFRMKDSIVHVGLGKVSFTEENLHENIGAFVNALLLAKPAGLKKTSKYAGYVNSFHLCSTMGPGFPISIQSLSKAADLYNKLHPR